MSDITKPVRKRPPAAGRGRKKGSKNKIPRELKEMILTALSEVAGVDYLVERARDPKTQAAFLTLVGKVLPYQMTGAAGGPLPISGPEQKPDRRAAQPYSAIDSRPWEASGNALPKARHRRDWDCLMSC